MNSGPERDVTRADVLSAMRSREDSFEPWTSTEVAEAIDCARRTAFDRLHELRELGEVETKEVGANARIWWIPASQRE